MKKVFVLMVMGLLATLPLTAHAALISTGSIEIAANTAGSTEGLSNFTGSFFFMMTATAPLASWWSN